MRCNIIAQRISLQEYMRDGKKYDEVMEEIDEWTQEEEKLEKPE
jgi:hypothetical protein